jgi:hypothetical protein
VKILVTPEKGKAREFSVYQGLLEQHSKYFARECGNGQRKELLELPNEDPSIFGYFVQWLNAQDFEYDPSQKSRPYIPLINLWKLAQRIKVPKLADAAVQKVFWLEENSGVINMPIHDEIKHLYERTKDNEESKQLRKVFVHFFAYHANGDEIFRNTALKVCAEFVADVAERLIELRLGKSNKFPSPKAADFPFQFIRSKTMPEIIVLDDDEEEGGNGVVDENTGSDDDLFVRFMASRCKDALLIAPII